MIFDAKFFKQQTFSNMMILIPMVSMLGVLGVFLSWFGTCKAFAGSCLCLKVCLISFSKTSCLNFSWTAWNMMNNACNTFFFFRSFDVLEVTLQDPRLPNPDSSRLCIHHSTCCMASWCIALCYVTSRNIINKWIEGTMDTALEHGKLPRHPACPCVVLPICNFEHITYVASSQRAWRKNMICWVSLSFDFPFFTSQFDFVYASSIFRFVLNQIWFENKLSGKNNFLGFGRPNNQTLNPMVNEVRSNAGRSWSWKTASQIWFET